MRDGGPDDIESFAASGPAFADLARFGPIDWAVWRTIAERLTTELDGAPDLARRVHHLYLPVLFFCAAVTRAATKRPLLIGVQAPQGGGKTTMVRHLLEQFPALGLRGTGVSIDDFYLTRADQLALAAANPGNPYLEHRGYPGTHDIELGERTLQGLKSTKSTGSPESPESPVRIPVYDKSAHGGRGDRAPEPQWRSVEGPLDVVFVEGWLLGFTPVPETSLDDPFLVEPNRMLAAYDRWHRWLDAFVVLRAADPTFVLRWRVQAEEAMKAQGRPGLDRAAIEDYIRRFLPAYARYGGAPPVIPPDRRMEIWLDAERRPIARL